MDFTEEDYFNPPKPMTKKITVTLALSKTFDVDIEGVKGSAIIDEDGFADIDEDISTDQQWDAVTEQHVMPYEAYKYVGDKAVIKDLQGWDVDNIDLDME